MPVQNIQFPCTGSTSYNIFHSNFLKKSFIPVNDYTELVQHFEQIIPNERIDIYSFFLSEFSLSNSLISETLKTRVGNRISNKLLYLKIVTKIVGISIYVFVKLNINQTYLIEFQFNDNRNYQL